MARMKRPTYTVWCTDPTSEDGSDEVSHVVEIEWADQLRGEFEAGKYNVDTDAPMNLTNVWIWCAMTRLGLTTSRYPEWKAREIVGLEKVKDPETGTPVEDVDGLPTVGRSESVSGSPSPTPAPPSTGS